MAESIIRRSDTGPARRMLHQELRDMAVASHGRALQEMRAQIALLPGHSLWRAGFRETEVVRFGVDPVTGRKMKIVDSGAPTLVVKPFSRLCITAHGPAAFPALRSHCVVLSDAQLILLSLSMMVAISQSIADITSSSSRS